MVVGKDRFSIGAGEVRMNVEPVNQSASLRRAGPFRPFRAIAVTSGKGGVGKTSLAVNLALAWARTEQRTCLLDGDLGLANVDVLLNLHPRHSLRDVITGAKELEDVITPGPAGLQVIPAASGVEALANLSGAARRGLAARLERLSHLADVAVLDTGAGISPTVLTLALAADEVLVVTTPEPTALTDAYAMVKVLTRRQRDLSLQLVVNFADHASQAREVHGHLDRITRRFLGRQMPLAGWVPRDACVERAVQEQRPFLLYFPHSRAAEAIRDIARRLGRGRQAPASGQFWTRLAGCTESP
jgi:flagellar biosynthesis protein FlhG